jgi:hypothetical protein
MKLNTNAAVIFENMTPINPYAWSVMGMSAKETNNPIGEFGTGLKYSIATLLRNGHSVEIHTEGQRYEFSTEQENFRGKDFSFICCNGQRLPFTTELGKNWKIWQAFRELRANALDENGMVREWDGKPPFATGIIVSGREFYKVLHDQDHYFVDDSTALAVSANIAIRSGSGKFYYRGNLAGENFRNQYNYDFKDGVKLTEDRTLVADFSLLWEVARGIIKLRDKDLIRDILQCPPGSLENGLTWDHHAEYASEQFMEVAVELYTSKPSDISSSLRAFVLKNRPSASLAKQEMSPMQGKMLDKAKSVLFDMGYTVKTPIHLVETQSSSIAFAHRQEIFLTGAAFRSVEFLAQVLLEEWAHAELGFKDESREFQNWLIDQIFLQSSIKES